LRSERCCALDWTTPQPAAASAGEVEHARARLAAGDREGAEQALIALLEAWPLHSAALRLLQELCAAKGRLAASEALLARVVRLDPNDLAATQALALALFNRRALAEAEAHARNAVRLAPLDAQSHNLMGMIMTEAHRPQVGERHYRRAMALLPHESPILFANLAWNLKNQGRIEESRRLYEKSVALDPAIFQTLFGWAQMEETDRNFARAGELLDAAEKLAPGAPSVRLQRAVLHGRVGDYDKALAALEEIEKTRQGRGLGPLEWTQKGQLLDKMGRYDEAFAAFAEGKRVLREITGQAYLEKEAQALAARLKAFFVARRAAILPRAGVRADVAQPIFVVGFPRSGTTMVEQTLSAHPRISAGDELPTINEITALMPRMLASPLAYPEALAELWMGDQAEGLDNLRDYYLQRARQLGATRPDADRFTDKMPLNETHLGLIGLVFPDAPIVHVVRHPLDVALSVFSNHLTHGFYCAYDLDSVARHYVLTMDLVEHYLRELRPRYLRVRYEDIVADQEARVREMLAFVGAPFDRRCLDFHENRRYARTASYAQVAERLYDHSVHRWRAYRDRLAPIVPILEPTIHRLGYRLN
jgi:tetratricopeptide (TPR) repeat protein